MGHNGQIVAFGGGGFSMEPGNRLLDDYVLGLTGRDRPRVCFLPTASGDADHYIVRFYREFADGRADASHLTFFRRDRGPRDVRAHLLSQDLIYVGGGSLVSLLGVWRAHGIDEILAEAWRRGTVLCGPSAGALCWFSDAITAYYGAPTRERGLGFLPWSFTAHYDTEPERRDEFHRGLAEGMAPGFAADDSAALHFVGTGLHRAITSREGARALTLRRTRGGRVREEEVPTVFLGAPKPSGAGRASSSRSARAQSSAESAAAGLITRPAII